MTNNSPRTASTPASTAMATTRTSPSLASRTPHWMWGILQWPAPAKVPVAAPRLRSEPRKGLVAWTNMRRRGNL